MDMSYQCWTIIFLILASLGRFIFTMNMLWKVITLYRLSQNYVFERYDFDAMLQDDIYPIASDGDKDEFFDYLFTYLKEIKFFYEKAASKGKGIIFYIL